MILAIDVDGVCADLLSIWLQHYNRDYGDLLTVGDILEWDIHKFVKPECGENIYDYLAMPELYDEVKPIDGALTTIKMLRDLGHRIIYATATPIESSGAKFKWLVRHGFLPEHGIKDYMEVSDKSLIRADLLLDDAYHNVKAFHGSIGVLYNRLYNVDSKNSPWKYRVMNWVDFYNKFINGEYKI